MTYRLGMQFDWDKSWLQSDVGRLTGYWSGAYTYWEGDKTSSNNSLSFSPVFVYEFAGQNVKPYVEAGIGVAVFSHTEVEDNNIGQAFQFEDRFGFGLRFAGGHEVGIRATHYSNAGHQQPQRRCRKLRAALHDAVVRSRIPVGASLLAIALCQSTIC